MGALVFGTKDEIDCFTDQTIPGPSDGEQLCLANKVSMHFFGAGIYVGKEHVLKIKGSSSYYPLTPQLTAELQANGTLPSPLPALHAAWYQYAFGYSLWLLIAIMALAAVLQRIFGKLAPFLRANVAPVTGPPIVRTDDDRWLSAEIARHLEPGERVQHQAFGFDGDANHGGIARYVALTDRRLLVLPTRHGMLGPKKETLALIEYPREDIVAVGQRELIVSFDLADGSSEYLFVNPSQRSFTNQWLFARDVPKLLLG